MSMQSKVVVALAAVTVAAWRVSGICSAVDSK